MSDWTWSYSVTQLSNGLISILCRKSGLRGCYHADGSRRHGDLKLSRQAVLALIGK
jgi:hypothetical protein